jgi:hypothetical protein
VATMIRRSRAVRRPCTPGVAENPHRSGTILPADGEQLGADRREHLEVGEGFHRLPAGVAKRLVCTDRKRAAANRAGEDRVDDVTSAGPRVDRLAHQQQPADLDAKAGLLEELAGRRVDHGLAGIDASAWNEPVGMATFFVTDQQDL